MALAATGFGSGMRTSHRWARARFDRYCDGELYAPEIGRLLDHLADCPDCSDDVRLLLAMKESLRRIEARAQNT